MRLVLLLATALLFVPCVAHADPPTPPAPLSAPALATHEGPRLDNDPPRGKRFYDSGWFWGALAAAAFAGGAVYLATRDNSPRAIHLELQVPR